MEILRLLPVPLGLNSVILIDTVAETKQEEKKIAKMANFLKIEPCFMAPDVQLL